jgi:hypothetical protein
MGDPSPENFGGEVIIENSPIPNMGQVKIPIRREIDMGIFFQTLRHLPVDVPVQKSALRKFRRFIGPACSGEH